MNLHAGGPRQQQQHRYRFDHRSQLVAFKWKLRCASVPELARLAARGRIKEAWLVWSAIGLLVDRTGQVLVEARKRNVSEPDVLLEITNLLKQLRAELVEGAKKSHRADPHE
jgi:hypothetical protein